MATTAERTALWRRGVEEEYLLAEPEIEPRDVAPDERPESGRRFAELLRVAGFTTREVFERREVYPKWTGVGRSGIYAGTVRDLFHVGGLLPPLPLASPAETTAWLNANAIGQLVALEVTWTDGKAPFGRVRIWPKPWASEGVVSITARLKGLS